MLMKTKKFLALIFLFLSLGNSAYYECKPSFYYTIPITITDQYYRAIPNAYVSVYYQVSGTIIENGSALYVYTPEVKTNETGKVTITLYNRELTKDRLDCNIKVKVRLYGKEFEYSYNLEEIPKTILIQIPSAKLNLEVRDQNSVPLKGKAVIGDEIIEIDGKKSVIVPQGPIEVLVAHKRSKKFYSLNIKEDTTLTFVFNYETIVISSYGSNGKALPLKVYYDNETKEGVGEVEIRIPEGETDIIVETGGERRKIRINTETSKYYKIIIDKDPPSMEGVKVEQDGVETVLSVFGEDRGKYASGMKKVVAEFTFNDGTYIVREMKDIGGGFYEVRVDKTGEFEFKITAYDKEGNKVILTGYHQITYKDNPLNIEEVKNDELLPIVIGILVVGLIGGGIYIKKKLKEMEEI